MNRRVTLISLSLAAALMGTAARAADDSPAQDLQMAADSAPYREVADQFIARSIAGDIDGMQALLSRQLVGRIGDTTARQALRTQIAPFFQGGRRPGGAVTVTQTTDASGQKGFAFYLWMQYAANADARPFAVYVVKEMGRPVVANIVPDRLVEGRHR